MIDPDKLCEAVVRGITATWGDPGPASVEWGFALDHDESKTTGRRVNVFPDPESPEQVGGLRRGEWWEHAAIVIVWEKCPDADRNPANATVGVPGQPTREWMAERVRWAMHHVFLAVSRHRDGFRLDVRDADTNEVTELSPERAEVVHSFDPVAAARGVFVAQFRIVYREME